MVVIELGIFHDWVLHSAVPVVIEWGGGPSGNVIRAVYIVCTRTNYM